MAAFLKRRDPRFLNSAAASDPIKAKALEAERLQQELSQAAKDRALQREKEAKAYKEQAWQKTQLGFDSDEESSHSSSTSPSPSKEEGEEGTSDIEDLQEEDFWCAACDKGFQSLGAWTNHERSKKHVKNLKKYIFSVPFFHCFYESCLFI